MQMQMRMQMRGRQQEQEQETKRRSQEECDMPLPHPPQRVDGDWVHRMHHRAIFQVNEALHVAIHTPRTEDRWVCLKRDRQFELHARRSNTARSVCYLAVNEVLCAFEDVNRLLRFETTTEFQHAMQLLYGRSFRDGTLEPVVLQWSETDTDSDVMDAVHAKVSMRLQERQRAPLGRERTLSFFQALMILHPDCLDLNTNGSTLSMYTRPSESIKKRTLAFAWLPDVETRDILAQEVQDVRLQCTMIVEEVSHHRLRVSCVATSYRDRDDAHSSRASRTLARRFAARLIANLDSAVMAVRLSTQMPLAHHEWVRDEDRASCVICWKPFNSVFRRRHHCRLCGEVVCRWCSSLRWFTNAIRSSSELERVRMCHLCTNQRRPKHESFASASTVSQPCLPTLTATDDDGLRSSLYPSLYSLPCGLRSEDVVERSGEDDDMDLAVEEGMAKAMAALADDIVPISVVDTTASSKILSIKSLPRSEITRRSVPPSFFSVHAPQTKAGRQSYGGASRISSDCGVRQQRRHSDMSSVAFHPPYSTPMEIPKRRTSVAASQEPVPDSDDTCSSSTVPRRTSIMSLGMLDRYVGDDLAMPGRLDAATEANRLKLMNVICSPACTLVDRRLMRRCCEVVASTFKVEAAFVARVDEAYVVLEHAVGSKQLALNECLRRCDALCDFVLAQDGGEPLVVADCLADPRACIRENAMVRAFSIHFFAGVSIRVRGLPIACLCTFQPGPSPSANPSAPSAHDDGTESMSSSPSLSLDDITPQQVELLHQAARAIERELDQLVRGLVL